MSSYGLRQELHGHSGDVRSCCVLRSNGTTIVTGSRDRSVRTWILGDDKQYFPGPVNFDHPHWVNVVESLLNGFATGCHDHSVRVFDEQCNLLYSLGGHSGSVSSLSLVEDGTGTKLVSGSWDGTARVWDLNTRTCIRTLANHENIVCVLALSNGRIATGSTGMRQGNTVVGFKVRIFGPTGDEPIRVLEHHEGPVRCLSLCKSEFFSFASASNDGSINLYTDGGDFVKKLRNPPGFEGSPAFNYCVRDLAGEQDKLIAACDDCCARVWDCATDAVEELEHPATVWWTTALPNGDIITASGDGVVRLFSNDPMRQCQDEALAVQFAENARASREAQSKKVSPPVDVSKLSKIENAGPGASDQQVKMFNKNGTAYAYQWSAASQTWVEIGPVVSQGSGDGPEGKTELDGQYYDRVVPVEIEDTRAPGAGMIHLRLGFNYTDNPYVIANAFIRKHELPDDYTENIVQFINQQKQSGAGPTITQQSGETPAFASVPKQKAEPKQSKYFPLRDGRGIYFEKGSAEKAVSKIREMNATQSKGLSDRDFAALDSILDILKQTSRYHATEFTDASVQVLCNKLLGSFSLNDRFPCFDLIRAMLIHPDGGVKLGGQLGQQVFLEACTSAAAQGASTAVILTSLRAACNMFKTEASMKAALVALSDVATSPLELVASSSIVDESDTNIRTAVGTFFINCANAVYHRSPKSDRDNAILAQCVRGCGRLLKAHPAIDDEGAAKAMAALGCAGLISADLIKEVASIAKSIQAPNATAVWKDVVQLTGVQ